MRRVGDRVPDGIRHLLGLIGERMLAAEADGFGDVEVDAEERDQPVFDGLERAVLETVVTVLTFFAGMERVGPVVTSLLSTVEPLVAVLLGAFVLGERLSLLQGVGGLLILTAVVLLARPDKARLPTGPSLSGRGTG